MMKGWSGLRIADANAMLHVIANRNIDDKGSFFFKYVSLSCHDRIASLMQILRNITITLERRKKNQRDMSTLNNIYKAVVTLGTGQCLLGILLAKKDHRN